MVLLSITDVVWWEESDIKFIKTVPVDYYNSFGHITQYETQSINDGKSDDEMINRPFKGTNSKVTYNSTLFRWDEKYKQQQEF